MASMAMAHRIIGEQVHQRYSGVGEGFVLQCCKDCLLPLSFGEGCVVTDIAACAVIDLFIEGVEQERSKAGIRLVKDPGDGGRAEWVLLQEHQRVAMLSVSTPPPALLEEGEYFRREVGVDDGTDIALVDTHAKGVGGKENRLAVFDEPSLALCALLFGEPSVVEGGRDCWVGLFVVFAHRLTHSSGRAEDEGRAALMGGEEGVDRPPLGEDAGGVVADVDSIAGGLDEVGTSVEEDEAVELCQDALIGGGGEEEELSDGQVADDRAEFGESGAKAGAPADDGVRLIEDQHADGMATESGDDGRLAERLGVGDDHLRPPFDLGNARPASFGALAALQLGAGDAGTLEATSLVVHQGEERVDDDDESLDDEGGEHIAEALAAAGGEDHHRGTVVARGTVILDDALDDKLLKRPEVGNVEVLLGEGMDVHAR